MREKQGEHQANFSPRVCEEMAGFLETGWQAIHEMRSWAIKIDHYGFPVPKK